MAKIKRKLKKILTQYYETVSIQMSSSKLMNFLINDILDFAQINQGKFRKDCKNFNIEECIKEVVKIQKYKAEKLGVNVRTSFKNFEGVQGVQFGKNPGLTACICTSTLNVIFGVSNFHLENKYNFLFFQISTRMIMFAYKT